MKTLSKFAKISAILATCLLMGGCEDVQVYGSVGYSSYSGYGGYYGPRRGYGPGYGYGPRWGAPYGRPVAPTPAPAATTTPAAPAK